MNSTVKKFLTIDEVLSEVKSKTGENIIVDEIYSDIEEYLHYKANAWDEILIIIAAGGQIKKEHYYVQNIYDLPYLLPLTTDSAELIYTIGFEDNNKGIPLPYIEAKNIVKNKCSDIQGDTFHKIKRKDNKTEKYKIIKHGCVLYDENVDPYSHFKGENEFIKDNAYIFGIILPESFPSKDKLCIKTSSLEDLYMDLGIGTEQKILSNKERENLLLTIGALAYLLSKKSIKFAKGDKPNKSQISDDIIGLLNEYDAQIQGQSKSTISTKIDEGLKHLESVSNIEFS